MNSTPTPSTLENLNKAIHSCNLLYQNLHAILKTSSPEVGRIIKTQMIQANSMELKLMDILRVASVVVATHPIH